MTLNPQVASPVPAVDDLPIVVWPYVPAAAPLSPCPDWQMLIGTEVEIRRGGKFLGTGFVDDATPSGDVAWIAADGINNRCMIDKAGGYELSIAPTQLQSGPAGTER